MAQRVLSFLPYGIVREEGKGFFIITFGREEFFLVGRDIRRLIR